MPINDTFSAHQNSLTGPICGGFDIAPNDSSDLSEMTRALMVTTSGDVSVRLKNGSALILTGLSSGVIYPFRVMRVLATGTTATGIKGLV